MQHAELNINCPTSLYPWAQGTVSNQARNSRC